MKIIDDALRYPRLFNWNGPVSSVDLCRWFEAMGIEVDKDLFELMAITGGGDLFESETLLRPLCSAQEEDSILSVPSARLGVMCFHVGMGQSFFDSAERVFVVPSIGATARFGTLDEWYLRVIRAEYAVRYGIEEP